jgi:hypothetical protein
MSGPHPDAALIAACERHIVNHTLYNTLARVTRLDPDKDPLWAAYLESHEAVGATAATTLEGLVAKARAALVENDAEFQACETGGEWAYHVLRDLLRMHGRVE